MRPVHGPSKSEQKHRRQPEKSTPISSADSSKPRLSIIRICSTAVPTQEQERKGLVRMEGKDYIVRDGDVILFRFNV